jgi:hypothetical protein
MSYFMRAAIMSLAFVAFGYDARGQSTQPTNIRVDDANVDAAGRSCPKEALKWTKDRCEGRQTCSFDADPIKVCGYDPAPGEQRIYSGLFSCEGKEGADWARGSGGFSVSCLGPKVKVQVVK